MLLVLGERKTIEENEANISVLIGFPLEDPVAEPVLPDEEGGLEFYAPHDVLYYCRATLRTVCGGVGSEVPTAGSTRGSK